MNNSVSAPAKQTEDVSAGLKNGTIFQRVNIQMVKNIMLIWLDNNIDDDNNEDYHNTICQLRRVPNAINTFTDGDQCVQFTNNIDTGKASMIISGSLGEHIEPCIQDISGVDSIFIFCSIKKKNEQCIKEGSKINGVSTENLPMCEVFKRTANQCKQNITPISFIATSDDLSVKNLNQLDGSFMYTQIMKEILLAIKFEDSDIKDFIQHCYNDFAKKKEALNTIEQFERQYHDKTPVWWYTRDNFLYLMLNHALRIMNTDVIMKMGFFIGDLHRQIEQLHKEQYNKHRFGESFILYHGKGISKTDFEQMSKTKGGLISFNNFLFTSMNRDVSLGFARGVLSNPDMMGILFVMTIDPSQPTTPFASIKDVSEFVHENEVLFSMHSIFRIDDIKRMDENQCLFQVELTLTSNNDKDLQVLTKRFREEIDPDCKEWYRLGKLFLKLGQPDKAQQVYEVLLNQTTDDIEKALSYHHIGWAKDDKGEYEESLIFYEKALQIRQQLLPSNHPDLAKSFNHIGIVSDNMGQYAKALSSYKKALQIQQQSLPSNHPAVAASYNNIGILYKNMSAYSKALLSYEKTLEILQQSLPSNHPNVAACYNNIGVVYDNIGQYSKALLYYNKDLEITQQLLPPNHPDLASSYNNIGHVYEDMGDYEKSWSFYDRAVIIGQQKLPSNHPELKKWINNRDRVKKKF